jgi:hypothetical protein
MQENKNQTKFMTSSVQISEKVQEANKVAEPIVRAEGPHTTAKTLLMAACKDIGKILLHSNAARKIS